MNQYTGLSLELCNILSDHISLQLATVMMTRYAGHVRAA